MPRAPHVSLRRFGYARRMSSASQPVTYRDIFASRRLPVVLLLGFASGLPLALCGATLQAWMTVEGVDLKTIGLITLVGLPYTWKFLWAPALDRYVPPLLGRRRGWLMLTQFALVAGLAGMAMLSPKEHAWWLALLALFVAFASASQDVVFDAYKVDILTAEQRGLGAAMNVVGYRIAMIVSGAIALIIATGLGDYWGGTKVTAAADVSQGWGWKNTYLLMAALMGLGMLATLWAEEPKTDVPAPRTLSDAVMKPMREFFSRPGAWLMMLLIVLYKFGDAFSLALSTAFLIRGVGFSPADVGVVNKGVGLFATIIGVVFGGGMMVKLGLYRALMIFGILQAVTNLAYMALAMAGHNYAVMVAAVCTDNITGGMGTAAFVAFMMALTNKQFSATQFALLSALGAVGRVYVGPLAGYLTDPTGVGMGWAPFFFVTFLSALPGLMLLWWMRRTVDALDAKPPTPSDVD